MGFNDSINSVITNKIDSRQFWFKSRRIQIAFNPTTRIVYKMVKHTLIFLQQIPKKIDEHNVRKTDNSFLTSLQRMTFKSNSGGFS